MKIKLYEAFAGYSSQAIALSNLGIKVQHINKVEWYIPAIISNLILEKADVSAYSFTNYEEAYKELENYTFSSDSKKPINIRNINKKRFKEIYPYLKYWVSNYGTDITKEQYIQDGVDIFTYSFPCQDISTQGKHKGFEDKQTRSGLVWEVIRIIQNTKNKPKVLIMENVDAILNKTHINNFKKIISILDELGYASSYEILNASDFNVPQNRKRCFMVSVLKELNKNPFDFSKLAKNSLKTTLEHFIDLSQPRKEKQPATKHINENKNSLKVVFNKDNLYVYYAMKLYKFQCENRVNILEFSKVLQTLTLNNSYPTFYSNELKKCFYLNAMDRFLLMGLDKDKAQQLINSELLSENDLMKLSGNSIVINVLEALFKEVKEQYFNEGAAK
ncbi:DNA (cytosine-5-)-methyltransferase [Mycoplasma seminis]|uniref:Cytosine-specific methyltransferase n=1 Tax=Mycoplasma seminis TaxID=512749 RepID=A0ABY9HAC1_9MOLU|nr:DNA (cytosine-5-)-methyltransferase [Mycoplasma seminis]WLP85273.1 DNA (cytosine-5-)-methyltransferase [Mycoplasma seminis]